jgi:hypothetical protein
VERARLVPVPSADELQVRVHAQRDDHRNPIPRLVQEPLPGVLGRDRRVGEAARFARPNPSLRQ